jgi:hypothetical protein
MKDHTPVDAEGSTELRRADGRADAIHERAQRDIGDPQQARRR